MYLRSVVFGLGVARCMWDSLSGGQVALARVSAGAGATGEPLRSEKADLPLQRYIPGDGKRLQGPPHLQPIRDQSHGRANAQGALRYLS